MKVLNLEDDIYKHKDIKRALELCDVTEVDWCDNQEDGWNMIKTAIAKGRPYDLIITDMQYPLKADERVDVEAGSILIERLRREGIQTPVAVCSSMRLLVPEVVANIWYHSSRDFAWDIKEMLYVLSDGEMEL